ncbi:MAG: pyridoxamine 5'-phosphate oxidase family protein [Methanocorpusculum sp.]|nr:pyridoxamine 5'-phosphate oxidase family protein [Methanocorpusculum sp.]
MRRKRQMLALAECAAVLERGTSGVLAVSGDDGYPYAVPLSYVFCGSAILFHCAPEGHKLDAIRRSDKVSFCVTDCDTILPERFTTAYRSVIVFGRAHVVLDEAERRAALTRLGAKYSPAGVSDEVERTLHRVCIIEMTIEHMTGKEAIELVKGE